MGLGGVRGVGGCRVGFRREGSTRRSRRRGACPGGRARGGRWGERRPFGRLGDSVDSPRGWKSWRRADRRVESRLASWEISSGRGSNAGRAGKWATLAAPGLPLCSSFADRAPALETRVVSRFYRSSNGNDLWSTREGGRIPENGGSEGTRWRQAHSQSPPYPRPHNSQEKGTVRSRARATWTPASGPRWNRACSGMWEPRPRRKYTVCKRRSRGTCRPSCIQYTVGKDGEGGRSDGLSRAVDE